MLVQVGSGGSGGGLAGGGEPEDRNSGFHQTDGFTIMTEEEQRESERRVKARFL